MSPKRFAAHGDWRICWCGSLLMVEFCSAFNREGIQNYIQDIKEVVLSREVSSWQFLAVFEENALGTPEALEIADGLFNWYHENGCDSFTFVVSNAVQRMLVRKVVVGEFLLFGEKSEALQWLNEQYNNIELE
ncbi:hypothetical protein [Thalassotalea atypica]|uniref:hypothetical protein n=1 Tax=Thalassotalea atypica TaxID=2054316 RepID=UPI0025724B46|nr:hypothetical protein [Thalassotalea atypica]